MKTGGGAEKNFAPREANETVVTGGVENETFAMEENDSVIAKEERAAPKEEHDRRAPGFSPTPDRSARSW